MSEEKKFYQMRLPDSEENSDVLNFIKNAKTSFNSSKINFPRGQKSQADRAIWLMNYALDMLSRENKVEGASTADNMKQEVIKDKNDFLSLLK
ncbi:hypothetical protein [Fluviispira vulneris]|uniref:hypothetical protein n=1 Tax=Fluviispira vulneris TaxID=2763012 RepID=UPI00164605CE|nr:hypothetical protein [Fluviispira vulneris]